MTWEETERPLVEAAAKLFPASAGTLAVEPSTAYDDVERLLTARARLEARLRRGGSSAPCG